MLVRLGATCEHLIVTFCGQSISSIERERCRRPSNEATAMIVCNMQYFFSRAKIKKEEAQQSRLRSTDVASDTNPAATVRRASDQIGSRWRRNENWTRLVRKQRPSSNVLHVYAIRAHGHTRYTYMGIASYFFSFRSNVRFVGELSIVTADRSIESMAKIVFCSRATRM